MSLEWESKSFSELVDIIGGGTPKTSIEEYWNGDIPWISIKDFNNGQKYVLDTEKTITELGLNNSSTKLLKKDDIIISARGTVGEVAMIKYEMAFNQSCYGLRVHDYLDKEFVYYLLKYNIYKLKNMVHGAVFDTITTNTFDNIIVNLPPFEYQEKISYLLSNIDNLIEVKIHENQNLEQLSQNLFRKWFIDFNLKDDFNISEPFKDSTLGEIPESWEIKTIGDLSDVKGRIGWRGYTTNDLVDEGPWVVGGKEITSGFIDFNTAKHLTREKYEESPEIMLRDKDLIIAKTGTIGPIAMYYDIYGEATLNPNVGLIRSKNITPALLLTFFKTPRAQHYLNEFTTSSVQPAINQTTIKQLEIALPSDIQLLLKIGNKFEEINSLQFNLNEEIKKLQRLRDTLLPKLMSGEIDVSKINCDLE